MALICLSLKSAISSNLRKKYRWEKIDKKN